MKREVTDIRDLRAELSTEDQELMRFFPQNRRYALDDMLLVRRGAKPIFCERRMWQG